MKLIDKDSLCEALMTRWSTANEKHEEIIREVMADVVVPIVVSAPTIHTKLVKYYDSSESVWKVGEVIVKDE